MFNTTDDTILADIVVPHSSTLSNCKAQLCYCRVHTLSLELSSTRWKWKVNCLSVCPASQLWTLTFPPTRGKMCIFPVRLSFTEATIKQVPQRMTCRSAHLCSWVLPFLTLNTPLSKVRSCWSAFTGRSETKKPTHRGYCGSTGQELPALLLQTNAAN